MLVQSHCVFIGTEDAIRVLDRTEESYEEKGRIDCVKGRAEVMAIVRRD